MNGLLSIIGYPLGWIMWLCYKIVPSYVVALIMFSFATKALMFPLSVKQKKSSAQQMALQPKINALQKQYANNKDKLNEEMTKVYSENNYNPLSGCLPLLIQFPILFGLIDVIYKPITHILRLSKDVINTATEIITALPEETLTAIGYRSGYPELSIVSIAKNDPEKLASLGSDVVAKIASLNTTLFGIDLGQRPTFGLNLLMLIPIFSLITAFGSMLVTNKINQKTLGDAAQNNSMKGMMYVMPFMSFIFAFSFPAGIGIYWAFSNLFVIVQELVIYKLYDPQKLYAEALASFNSGKKKKKSKFAQAMAQAVEEQNKKNASSNTPVEKASETKVIDTKEAKERAKQLREEEKNRLAEARRRAAEKYGDEYIEDDGKSDN